MNKIVLAAVAATFVAGPALAGSHIISFGSYGTYVASFDGDYCGTNVSNACSRSWILENATGWDKMGADEAAAKEDADRVAEDSDDISAPAVEEVVDVVVPPVAEPVAPTPAPEAPVEAPVEAPSAPEAPVEAPVEAPSAPEAPVEAPVEAPSAPEAPVEAPVRSTFSP